MSLHGVLPGKMSGAVLKSGCLRVQAYHTKPIKYIWNGMQLYMHVYSGFFQVSIDDNGVLFLIYHCSSLFLVINFSSPPREDQPVLVLRNVCCIAMN